MTDELQEKIIWQNINSSKDKGKILNGKIIAIEIEKMKEKNIVCAVIDFKGVKILIPANELIEGGKNDKKVLRAMMGTQISFIVLETDKIAGKAVGSRIKAMMKIRNMNLNKIEVGDKIYSTVVGIWKKYLRLECVGIDFIVNAKNLQYGFVEDVSKIYKINEQIKVIVKEIDVENETMKISVKELQKDPFKEIRKDFVEGR